MRFSVDFLGCKVSHVDAHGIRERLLADGHLESSDAEDVAVINGQSGLVEEINLRTTVLRGEDGAVHIFPNGIIQGLTNLTREYSYYVFNLSVSYTEDIDRVVEVLQKR